MKYKVETIQKAKWLERLNGGAYFILKDEIPSVYVKVHTAAYPEMSSGGLVVVFNLSTGNLFKFHHTQEVLEVVPEGEVTFKLK